VILFYTGCHDHPSAFAGGSQWVASGVPAPQERSDLFIIEGLYLDGLRLLTPIQRSERGEVIAPIREGSGGTGHQDSCEKIEEMEP
jgi:hypothetical protein